MRAYFCKFRGVWSSIWAILDIFRAFGPRFRAFRVYLGEFGPGFGPLRANFLESEPGFGQFRGLGLDLGHLGPISAYFMSSVTGFRPLWAYSRTRTTHTGADPGFDVGDSRNGMKWTQWGHWPAGAGARLIK